MTNELAPRPSNQLAPVQDWGNEEELNSDNVIIPKVLTMQLTSQFVKDGQGMFGELRDSLSTELLAKPGEKLAFIPIDVQEAWLEYHQEKGDWVFDGIKPYNNATKNLAKEETVNGVTIKRIHNMNFYVLLKKDLEQGVDLPKIIPFRVTSIRAGKVLYTRMKVLNKSMGLSPAGYTMAVNTKRVDGEKGSYQVLEVTPVEKTSDAYVTAAKVWYDVIKSGKTKVDESVDSVVE